MELTIQPTSCRLVHGHSTFERFLAIEKIKPKFMEMVNIHVNGKKIQGQVIKVRGDKAVVQVFEDIDGLDLSKIRVECTGEAFQMPVSEDMIGGFFDGLGKPRDKTFVSYPEKRMDVQGRPINPLSRNWPDGVIMTGVGTIDLMNTISIGHVYTIFSAAGLPHNELAAQIMRQATVAKPTGYWAPSNFSDEFCIVFAGIELSDEAMRYFTTTLQETKHPVTSFMSSIRDSVHERWLTPRLALTFAEYLAYEKQKHVMVVISDMSAYCDVLRQFDHGMVAARQRYTAYAGSDLASLLERGGVVQGSKGSLTIVPIVTVPSDDLTHPVADLIGAHTDNYLVLSRRLHNLGVYPPIDIVSLYKIPKAVGNGVTREDHRALMFQLDVLYYKGHEIAAYKAVVGESSESIEILYMEFKDAFDRRMIAQSWNESRDMQQVLDLAWDLLRMIPRELLNNGWFFNGYIEKYYPKKVEGKED